MGKQSLDIEAGFLICREHVPFFESFTDMLGIVKFYTHPISVVYFRGLVGGATTPEWVQDDVSGIGGNQNGAFRDHEL